MFYNRNSIRIIFTIYNFYKVKKKQENETEDNVFLPCQEIRLDNS